MVGAGRYFSISSNHTHNTYASDAYSKGGDINSTIWMLPLRNSLAGQTMTIKRYLPEGGGGVVGAPVSGMEN
jgi:hypothetical protein